MADRVLVAQGPVLDHPAGAHPDHAQGRDLVEGHRTMRETASALLHRARRADAVRGDPAAADLLALVNGVAPAGAAACIDRLLHLVREGVDATPPADGA